MCGDYVTEESSYSYGETKEEEQKRMEAEEAAVAKAEAEAQAAEAAAQSVASGQEVIDYACQFIGNPYVWGGTSLTDGADCSGFVQSVYAHFGISLPRTSYEQRSAGYEVSYEDAQPGDLILYEGHVGLYIGNDQIVNAMNEDQGIGISSATYTNIVAVRRIYLKNNRKKTMHCPEYVWEMKDLTVNSKIGIFQENIRIVKMHKYDKNIQNSKK